MEFTKALRKYLSERKGKIVDCAALHEGVFCVVPYKTLTKVINRFVKDGTLLLVSKGVYLVACDQAVDVDKAIEDCYAFMTDGMEVGNGLYRRLGFPVEIGKRELLTNVIGSGNKNVGDCLIHGCGIRFFGYKEKWMVELLELLSDCGRLMEIDPVLYTSQVQGHCRSYSDAVLEAVLKGRVYPKTVISKLSLVLSKMGIVNHCVEIYERTNGI
ncbi:MAG: hypothetical protein J6328_02185 [Bacilli bacterium]|nr:hypothetical protein [Bacilli bacterium]